MELKVKKKSLLLSLPLYSIIAVVYINSTVFSIRYRLSLLIIIVASFVLLSIATLKCITKKRKFSKIDILLFAMGIIVFFNNYDLKNNEPTYEIIAFLIISLAIIDKEEIPHYCRVFINFSYWFGLAAAVITIVCFFSPNFYLQYIFPLADENSRLTLLYNFQHGYQAGFSLHYSSNGIFLALLVGVVFCKWINSCEKKKKRKYIIMLLISFFALFLTAKRAHVIFSLFALFVVYYFHYSDQPIKRITKVICALFLAVVIFAIVATFVPAVSNVFGRFVGTGNDTELLLGERAPLYTYAILLFLQAPIVGHGWNSYKYFAETALGEYIAAHNVYLQLLAETGIIGFLIFILFIIMSVFASIHYYIHMAKNKGGFTQDQKVGLAFALFFQIFFLLYCFSGNPLYESRLLVPIYFTGILCIKRIYG